MYNESETPIKYLTHISLLQNHNIGKINVYIKFKFHVMVSKRNCFNFYVWRLWTRHDILSSPQMIPRECPYALVHPPQILHSCSYVRCGGGVVFSVFN